VASKEIVDSDDLEYFETIEEMIDDLEDQKPFLNSSQRKLLRSLKSLRFDTQTEIKMNGCGTLGRRKPLGRISREK
jgi:hypothetical protein